MDKKTLRNKFRTIRREMTDELKAEQDILIQRKFLQCREYSQCENLLIYVSGKIEVDTNLIISQALKEKNVYCPKCYSNGVGMDFYRINSISQLKAGKYGIYEPDENLPVWNMNTSGSNLCVVPGLSFDLYGYRLGFGMGYYDRFLVDFPGVTTGLCYEKCVCDSLPAEENDVKVQKLITEKMIYNFENK